MKKTNINFLIILIIVIFSFNSIGYCAQVGGETVTSKSACIIDFETGEVLYGYNENMKLVPASITKLATVYCVYQAIENGEISLDTPVPIYKTVMTKPPLYKGEFYTVDEILDATLITSSNASAEALALLIGGDMNTFLKRMNSTVANMGIDAVFYDPHGLSDKNMISAKGVVNLAKRLITDYPQVLERTSKRTLEFRGKSFPSTNKLLSSYLYPGADGLKTGTTDAAGYCFCGTAVSEGRRIIAVTMGSTSTKNRFIDITKLLNYGFDYVDEHYDNIFYTDMKTFINGYEMPTFCYKDKEAYAVVVAEDLSMYGFDVVYIDSDRTLYITRNENKIISPIDTSIYKGKDNLKALDVIKSDIKIVLQYNGHRYTAQNVHNTEKYLFISVDELAKLFSYEWNTNAKTGCFEI